MFQNVERALRRAADAEVARLATAAQTTLEAIVRRVSQLEAALAAERRRTLALGEALDALLDSASLLV